MLISTWETLLLKVFPQAIFATAQKDRVVDMCVQCRV